MNRALIITILLVATTARANVWQRALDRGNPANDQYETAMREGDEYILVAHARSLVKRVAETQLSLAVESYRRAAAARPTAGEPYFRIANSLQAFYFKICTKDPRFIDQNSPLCDPERFNTKRADEEIAAINAFEARSPLDPRFCNAFGSDLWFERAILNTKFGTKERLELAERDYRKLIDCKDPSEHDLDTVWSNLAETHMMLGNVPDAIDAYGEALRNGGNISTHYGLAVALDRDESPAQARDVILRQGLEGINLFERGVAFGDYFYVPKGEEFYYLALAQEAFGRIEESIMNWRRFIQSGAHKRFQPRAKAHLDALLVQQRLHPRPPPPPDIFESFP